ncbi:ATP-binding protein [Ideonella sp. DXS22W]|uniref:histidine kinase n=1 Tax=Pseudaquabacterium inlustre TaxID=2984192 RepID=A0ABU9CNU6_9BURK
MAEPITGFDALPPPPGQPDEPAADEAGPGRRLRLIWQCLLLALGYGAAAMLSIALSREPGSVANIWYANAVAVVVLLRQPVAHWPALLLAVGLANVAANRWWGDQWSTVLLLAVPNLLEVALAAWSLRRLRLPAEPLRAPMSLLRLLLHGAFLPPLAAAVLAAVLLGWHGAREPWLVGLTWLEGGTIGAVSVLPLGLALAPAPWQALGRVANDLRAMLMLPLAVGLSLVCLAVMPYPFVYVLLPLLAAAILLDMTAVALLTLSVSLTIALALGTGVLLPPPTTAEWQLGLVYMAVAAVLVPALLLASAVAAWRDDHARLLQRSEQLERAHAGLRQFVHAASHDLREPLNAITQFNALVRDDHGGRLPPDARDWLGRVASEAQRMRAMLDEVLQYAQVQRLSLPPPQAVALDTVLAEVLSALPAAQRAAVRLSPLPVVAGQQGLLVQLFAHLVGNALKFVAPGQAPEVSVRALARDGWAAVVVADHGIGIAEADLPRLFQPFQRLHRRADYPGTGLGLALCQQVVMAHGGDITLRSRPGQGTRVLVRLPLWAAAGRGPA